MRLKVRNRQRPGRRAAGGFSLIEVLISILVLAIGLLGFALTQTMSVRFATGANQRTQATNLAYDLIDQMRANRLLAMQYQSASFAAGAFSPTCRRPAPGATTIAANISRWQCQAARALGPDAAANVQVNDGVVIVRISWGEERWRASAQPTSFVTRSRL